MPAFITLSKANQTIRTSICMLNCVLFPFITMSNHPLCNTEGNPPICGINICGFTYPLPENIKLKNPEICI